ncbi:FAD-dependent monooxygenase [Pelistega suis]|uniref:FAD-dependent monooxygenase n=1 Tax=Pelistega suis TaxID=1631957 RepID=UPI00211BA167|nr:FAD-dependent monooxygenase [Pelistega suis]MCQ9327996.1 FAD-dependent monooxygenase [Pelistega suis]
MSQVIVCGAGIVGMAMSLALSQKGIKTRLLAPKYVAQASLGEVYHPRIYAISLASQRLLSELGVWSLLPENRLTAVEQMQIQGDQAGQLNLSAELGELHELAWIVESGEIEAALQKALMIYRVEWLDDKVMDLSLNPSAHPVVHTEKGHSYTADLVIAADGSNSVIRQKAGIWHQAKSYESKGLVAQFTTEKSHHHTAYQWFTEEGVLAFLPLPDTQDGHQISMVWSASNDVAKELESLNPEELALVLQKRIGHLSQDMLGELTLRSPMYGFPLTLEKSGMVAPGVALVGDAAHRVHPLAGQGLNLGLGDVQTLCRILSEKPHYRELGDSRLLQTYQRERSVPIAHMRWVTDGLHGLFSSQLEPIKAVRNIGMDIVAKLPFVKEFLIKKASGL